MEPWARLKADPVTTRWQHKEMGTIPQGFKAPEGVEDHQLAAYEGLRRISSSCQGEKSNAGASSAGESAGAGL